MHSVSWGSRAGKHDPDQQDVLSVLVFASFTFPDNRSSSLFVVSVSLSACSGNAWLDNKPKAVEQIIQPNDTNAATSCPPGQQRTHTCTHTQTLTTRLQMPS